MDVRRSTSLLSKLSASSPYSSINPLAKSSPLTPLVLAAKLSVARFSRYVRLNGPTYDLFHSSNSLASRPPSSFPPVSPALLSM